MWKRDSWRPEWSRRSISIPIEAFNICLPKPRRENSPPKIAHKANIAHAIEFNGDEKRLCASVSNSPLCDLSQ